jgi:hypothetical protein
MIHAIKSRLTPEADAPEYEKLLADEAAIGRMAACLVTYYSEELGGIPLATEETAKDLVRSLLAAAT